jgi:hypothetical protein
LLGCGEPARAPLHVPVAVEPTIVDALGALLPSAGLTWLLRLQPRAIAAIPWLIPSLGRFLPEARLDAYRAHTGLDLRQLPEALVAAYRDGDAEQVLVVLRHNADAALLEQRFSARLAGGALRTEDRPDLVRVVGRVGRREDAFARIGRDVVAFQRGGDPLRGMLRVACLRALGKLRGHRSAVELEPVRALFARFGEAPVAFAMPGPFEGELRGAALGLLDGALGAGLAMRGTARGHLGLAAAIHADFGDRGAEAGERLGDVYASIARSSLGRIVGLDQPIEPFVVAGDASAATLSVELDARRSVEGLHALVEADVASLLAIE